MTVSVVEIRKTNWRGWSVALLVSAGVHAGLYHHFAGLSSKARQPDTPPRVMLSLIAAPVIASAPEPGPAPVAPVEPTPLAVETPPPKPRSEPKRVVNSPQPKRIKTAPAPPEPREIPQIIANVESPAAAPPVAADLPFEPPRADAAYLKNPPPSYPSLLLRRGVEGTVLLNARILDDGRCDEVHVKQSSGFDLFDKAALSAVKRWRFLPARKGTEAVVAWVEVPVAFEITRTR